MIKIYTTNQCFECRTAFAVLIICSASLIHLCLTCLFAFSSIFSTTSIVKTNYLHILPLLYFFFCLGDKLACGILSRRRCALFKELKAFPLYQWTLTVWSDSYISRTLATAISASRQNMASVKFDLWGTVDLCVECNLPWYSVFSSSVWTSCSYTMAS